MSERLAVGVGVIVGVVRGSGNTSEDRESRSCSGTCSDREKRCIQMIIPKMSIMLIITSATTTIVMIQ